MSKKLSPNVEHDLTLITGVSGIGNAENLSDDVRLIRSGLLYADIITVKSIGTTMLHQMLSLSSYGNEHMMRVLFGAMLNAKAFSDEQIKSIELLFQAIDAINAERSKTNRKVWRTDPRYEQLRRFQSQHVEKIWDCMKSVQAHFQKMWDGAGGQEIDAAVDAGILTFDTDWTEQVTTILKTEALEQKAEFFIDTLRQSSSAVLLDPMMEGIFQSLQNEGYLKLPKFRNENIRRTKLGTQMTVKLPNLSVAPVELILNVREEVEPRLHDYRKAVKKLDSTLHESAFSTDLEDEIDQLWNDEVLLQVQKIEEAVFDSKLGNFKDAVIVASKAATGAAFSSGLTFAVANIAQLLDDPLVAVGATTAAAFTTSKPLVESGLNGLKESRQKKKQLKSSELFYLADINHAAKKIT